MQDENDVETCLNCHRNFMPTEIMLGLCGDCAEEIVELHNMVAEEEYYD